MQASINMHAVTHFASVAAAAYVSMISILYCFSSFGMAWSMCVIFSSVDDSPIDDRRLRFVAGVGWLASGLFASTASVSGYLIANLSGLLFLLSRCHFGCWLHRIFGRHVNIVDTSFGGALCPGAAVWPW